MAQCQSYPCTRTFTPSAYTPNRQRFCCLRCQQRDASRRWRAGHPRPPKPSQEERFWARVKKTSKCWLWTGCIIKDGYGQCPGKDFPEYTAHRFSWHLHNGPIPDDLQVLHRCDVANCVRPDHLFLGTQLDNMRDRNEKGRANVARGPQKKSTKLTPAKVRAIRKKLAKGVIWRLVAEEYGVSESCIQGIKDGKNWAWVE